MGRRVGEIPVDVVFWTQKEKKEDEKAVCLQVRVASDSSDTSAVASETSGGKGCKYFL